MEIDTIGEQIQIAMKLRGVKRASHLSKLSGVCRGSIAKQIDGRLKMRRETLDEIAEALRCRWHKTWTRDGQEVLTLKVRKPKSRGN